ncbi:hypothetical protein [Phenylobacterium sp.]|uniref:hypothetical protein n=1 Tax=Phenylobacterium sp. TaxID=1871053 RepID=UPI0030F42B04
MTNSSDWNASRTGRRKRVTSVAALVALALAACSPQPTSKPAEPPAATIAPGVPPATPKPETAPTVGGDSSPIRLSALSNADLQSAALQGELGCSFSTPTASPLLVAMGVVASKTPAQGVVKVLDSMERVTAPGGFDAMLKGAVFADQGKTVTIALTGAAPVGGGESPGYPATLTYDRADGARLTLTGLWTCGP